MGRVLPSVPTVLRLGVASMLGLLLVAMIGSNLVQSSRPSPSAAAASSTGRTVTAEPAASRSTTYYIASDGDDGADGSRSHPWRTAIRASASLEPGDTLLARGGRYLGQGGEGWEASGTAAAPITFAAAPGESPIFDGDGAEQWLILRDVQGLVFRGLEITNYRPIRNGVLVMYGAVHDVTLDGLIMRGNANGADPVDRTAHLIYPGAGPVTNLTIRNSFLDAAGMGGGAIHVFHDPGPVNLLIENNDLRNGYWGVIIASNANGVTLRGNRYSGNERDVEVWDEARDVSTDR